MCCCPRVAQNFKFKKGEGKKQLKLMQDSSTVLDYRYTVLHNYIYMTDMEVITLTKIRH